MVTATTGRFLPRALMLIAGAGAIAVIGGVFLILGYRDANTWSVTAASFAVITSIISAWMAVSLLEMEREKRKPDVTCYLDFKGRQGLVLFRIENQGGSSAFGAELVWEEPMTAHDGNVIGFGNGEQSTISIIRPKQSFAKIIDSAHHTVDRHSEKMYRGYVKYRDSSGRLYKDNFVICADEFFGTPVDDDDVRLTAVKLQAMPNHLENISKNLDHIARCFSRPIR